MNTHHVILWPIENFLWAAEVDFFEIFRSQKGLKIRLKWFILGFAHNSYRNVHFWSYHDQFWARMAIVNDKLRCLVIKYNMKNVFWALSRTLEVLLCRCGRFFHVHAKSNSTKISVFTYKKQHIRIAMDFEMACTWKKRPQRQSKVSRVLESAQNAFFILYLITKYLSLSWTIPIFAQSWW